MREEIAEQVGSNEMCPLAISLDIALEQLYRASVEVLMSKILFLGLTKLETFENNLLWVGNRVLPASPNFQMILQSLRSLKRSIKFSLLAAKSYWKDANSTKFSFPIWKSTAMQRSLLNLLVIRILNDFILTSNHKSLQQHPLRSKRSPMITLNITMQSIQASALFQASNFKEGSKP